MVRDIYIYIYDISRLRVKLLLFTVILAVYQFVCAYTSMTILFFFNQFFDCKPYFIYVPIICCLNCDSFHIHMKLHFDWIYGK